MVADDGVGSAWGVGDPPPELMLTASRRGRAVVPPIPEGARVVLVIALPERVENALLIVIPYSASESPAKSSARNACCKQS